MEVFIFLRNTCKPVFSKGERPLGAFFQNKFFLGKAGFYPGKAKTFKNLCESLVVSRRPRVRGCWPAYTACGIETIPLGIEHLGYLQLLASLYRLRY